MKITNQLGQDQNINVHMLWLLFWKNGCNFDAIFFWGEKNEAKLGTLAATFVFIPNSRFYEN